MTPGSSHTLPSLADLPVAACSLDTAGRVRITNHAWGTLIPAPTGSSTAPFAEGPSSAWLRDALGAIRAGRATSASYETVFAARNSERAVLLQIVPAHDGHAITGFLLLATDVSPARRLRDALDLAAAASSRATDLPRSLNELWQHVTSSTGADALAVGVADGEGIRLVFAAGYDESDDETHARLAAAWHAASNGRDQRDERDSTSEITVSLGSSTGSGALTMRFVHGSGAPPPMTPDEIARAVGRLAALAVERESQRRRAEQRARLEAAAESAAVVAQELRDPVLGISSASQLLRFRAREDPVLEKNVGRMLRDVERLNRISSALLEFGRPLPIVRAPGDPDALWDAVVEANRGLLESRSLAVHRSRAEPVTLCAVDGEQLSRAFTLLLQSAAETAREASDLHLQSRRRHDGAWHAHLTSDSELEGESQRHALDLLFSSRSGSAGLGLALGRRIIEAHGGSLTLTRVQNSRTALEVMLPGA